MKRTKRRAQSKTELERRLDDLEFRILEATDGLETAITKRMREADQLICQATEVLRVLSTNVAKARDDAGKASAELELKSKARWDCVRILLEDALEKLNAKRLPAAEVVALVDAARVTK